MNPDTGGVASLTPVGERSLALETAARLLAGRFVFVGSHREEDAWETPYGEQLGVLVHAWAAHGLRSGQSIERLGRRWTFPMIFVLCYLLTAAQAGGGGRRAVLRGAALLSLAVLVTAVAAIRFGLVWMDVSYALAAIWLLAGVLVGGAAWQAARVRAKPAADAAAATEPGAGEPGVTARSTSFSATTAARSHSCGSSARRSGVAACACGSTSGSWSRAGLGRRGWRR